MDKRKKAVIQYVGAVLIWGTIGLFVRLIDLPSSFIAMSRGLTGALVLFGVLLARRRMQKPQGAPSLPKAPLLNLERSEIPLMLGTGAAIGLNWMLLFEAYNYTTVAVATLCYYFAPVLLIVAAPFVIKERITRRKAVCVAVAAVGVVLVSGVVGGGSAGLNLGVVLGLGAAVLYAANMLMNKLTPKSAIVDKTVVQLGAAGAVMIPYVLLTVDFSSLAFTSQAIALLLVLGVVHTGIAYMWYFSALLQLPAQNIAVLSYLDPACAVLISAFVLAEPLAPLAAVGAVLILGAAIASEWATQ